MWGGLNAPWDNEPSSKVVEEGQGQGYHSLSQESFAFSQLSQSQYSQYGGVSQGSFGVGTGFSLSQQSQEVEATCMECQSTEFETTEMGDMVCAVCGTAFDGNVNEQAELEETRMLSQGMRKRTVRQDKDLTPRRKGPTVFSNTRDCVQAFQFAIMQNVKIKLWVCVKQAFSSAAGLSEEAASEVKRLTSEIWFSYLERLTLPSACGDGGIRVRDDFRSTAEIATMRKANGKKEEAERETGYFTAGRNLEEGLQRGPRARGRKENWTATLAHARANPGYTVPPIDMQLIPAILYLCARWLRSPTIPLDFVRWIRSGTLPYMNCFSHLPPEIQAALGNARPFFLPKVVPVALQINILADRLAALLGLELPPLNTTAVATRFAKALGMPPKVLNSVAKLAHVRMDASRTPVHPATPEASIPGMSPTSGTSAAGGPRRGSGHRAKYVGGQEALGKHRDTKNHEFGISGEGRSSEAEAVPQNNDESGTKVKKFSVRDGKGKKLKKSTALKTLKNFLKDPSPVHAMALVVAAVRGCPGWDRWVYTRPALLPPTSSTDSGQAGTGAGGAAVNINAETPRSRGSIGTKGLPGRSLTSGPSSSVSGTSAGVRNKVDRGGGRAGGYLFVPAHAGEFHLLMRGRLPEFLRFVEAYSGGAESGGNWQNNGDLLSPRLEELALEIENKRRKTCGFLPSPQPSPPSSSLSSSLLLPSSQTVSLSQQSLASSRNSDSKGNGGADTDQTPVGFVRAAQVVAGASVARDAAVAGNTVNNNPSGRDDGRDADVLVESPAEAIAAAATAATADTHSTARHPTDGRSTASIPMAALSTAGDTRRGEGWYDRHRKKRAGRGPMDWGRGNEKLVPGEREFEWEGQGVWEPVTVYDPDDSIGRFHPRYELLIEACAYYLEVHPTILQEKVQELDRVLIDEELRFLRASKKQKSTEGRAREGRLNRAGGEAVNLRDVFARDAVPIAKFPHQPEVLPARRAKRGNPEAMIRWRHKQGMRACNTGSFTPEAPKPLQPTPGGAFVVVGGDTLRPPPPVGVVESSSPVNERLHLAGDAEISLVLDKCGLGRDPFEDTIRGSGQDVDDDDGVTNDDDKGDDDREDDGDDCDDDDDERRRR